MEERKRKHCFAHFSLHFNRAGLNKYVGTATTSFLLQANNLEKQWFKEPIFTFLPIFRLFLIKRMSKKFLFFSLDPFSKSAFASTKVSLETVKEAGKKVHIRFFKKLFLKNIAFTDPVSSSCNWNSAHAPWYSYEIWNCRFFEWSKE